MVFRERERLSLLGNDRDLHGLSSWDQLQKFNYKSICLALCAGLIPFLLWITIFQDYDNQPESQVLSQPFPEYKPLLKYSAPIYYPSSVPHPLPPNNFFYGKVVNPATEFGSKPKPKITRIGNKTVSTYTLIVTKGLGAPDNFLQPAYLINGQSPGPEIRVIQNSILIVKVLNKLDLPITFHFHGIHQRKSFLSDGVPQVTQHPIPPGETFTYEFNLWPQVGTFFYHAHTGMDIVWLYGPLIIEDDPLIYSTFPPAYKYDEDKVFIMNGVYHESLSNLITRITGPVHDYPGLISSLTINGRSFGNWSKTIWGDNLSTPSGGEGTSYDITQVQAGLTYRFRFINAASDSILTCNISSHKIWIIEMDGVYTEPVETDNLMISPGQRYSFLIKMDQEEDNYYVSCFHLEYNGPQNGFGILSYQNSIKNGTVAGEEEKHVDHSGQGHYDVERWIIDSLGPAYHLNQTDLYKVPMKVDKEWVINVVEVEIGKKHVYLLNGHYFQEPDKPYFEQLKEGVNITDEPQVFELIEGENVQIVFQNQRKGGCFSHPWHIHGHSFYVVGYGPNRYDPRVDGERIQREIEEGGKEYQFRDSVTVFANQTIGDMDEDGAWCGWAAVRIAAHNPGLWLAHCHITPHMMMGMKFVFWEHSLEDPYLTEIMRMNGTRVGIKEKISRIKKDPVEEKRLLVIDTDVGIDDAVALFVALKAHQDPNSDISIVAITTLVGNTDIQNTNTNLATLLAFLGISNIPIFYGASRALVHPKPPNTYWFGKDGFGDATNLTKVEPIFVKESAAEALIRLAHQHQDKLIVASIGPLSNIAMAINMDPTFSSALKELWVMGGNITDAPHSEFNFGSDPEAAYVVLDEQKFSSPIHLIPWETCEEAKMNFTFRKEVLGGFGTKESTLINTLEASMWIKYESEVGAGWNPCDALLISTLINQKVGTGWENHSSHVELDPNFKGMMIENEKSPNPTILNKDNILALNKVDEIEYEDMILWGFGANSTSTPIN